MDQNAKTSTRAIISLVVSIVAIPAVACFGCGGLILGLVAVIVGISARRQIADSGGVRAGKGIALAGIIIGAIAALLGLLFGLSIVVLPGMTLLGPGVQELFEDIVQQLGAG